jgi:UDP-N-acetylglucosamine 3-dehydrogenase
METLNVGVIGVGYMGFNHLRIYADLKECNLVGAVDVSQKPLKKVEEMFKVRTYQDVDKFIKENRVDAVSITVPTTLHFQIAKKFVEKGIHVLVEKPFTGKLEEAQKLVELSKKHKVKLAVGYVERFNPVVQRIKTIMTENLLKNTFYASTYRLNPSGRAEESAVTDLCTHDIDLLRYILNSEVESVHADAFFQNNIEKHVVAVLKFKNGIKSLIHTSLLYPLKVRGINISLLGMMIEGDFGAQDITVYRKKELSQEDILGEIDYETIKPRIQKSEPLRTELKDFLNSIKEDSQPLVDGNEGIRTLQVAIEIMRKTRRG